MHCWKQRCFQPLELQPPQRISDDYRFSEEVHVSFHLLITTYGETCPPIVTRSLGLIARHLIQKSDSNGAGSSASTWRAVAPCRRRRFRRCRGFPRPVFTFGISGRRGRGERLSSAASRGACRLVAARGQELALP